MLAPPPGSWRPLLGEILDPPLVTHSLSNRSKLYSVKAKRIARIILPVSTAAISYVLHCCRQHLSIGLSCRYPVSAIVLSCIWFQSEDVMSRFEQTLFIRLSLRNSICVVFLTDHGINYKTFAFIILWDQKTFCTYKIYGRNFVWCRKVFPVFLFLVFNTKSGDKVQEGKPFPSQVIETK